MVAVSVRCIHCDSLDIVKMGKQANGKQRYKCKVCGKTFQIQYASNGAKPQTKQLIIKMALNGSGVRDTARVLNISTNTVLSILKKQKTSKQT